MIVHNQTMSYDHLQFDTSKYDFVKLLCDLFKTDDLSLLNETHEELFKISHDSCTSFHDAFYNKYRIGWVEMEELYLSFVTMVCQSLGYTDVLYQKFPTFRVHIPNNVAVGAFHKDGEFNHPKGEINFIIPCTNSVDTASVWVESEPNKADFKPMPLIVGQLIKFNGNELTHGNKVNETELTRVSMDFRILPYKMYDENNSGTSMTKATKFKEGEYYKRLTL